ncbi:MAG: DNA primase [Syntrophobacteraceae bacterium]
MTVSGIATLVKQAVDIVEVIGRAVPLRRSGNRHVGLCPFHQEKTPSFQVDAENQLYYCFGCGSGGDVLSFVMKHQNLTFNDAVKFLSDRYNIPLPQKDYADGDSALLLASQKEREQILAAVACAAEFFHRQLRLSAEGRIAREYIIKRELPPEVVETQRLGYAPARWDGLLDHLRAGGFDPDLGVRAGLLSRGASDSSKFFDRFRNRLIFPIADERGRIVAFGGRSLTPGEQNEPKYLNSPETPVYHKGRMLYQYGTAREACRQVRQALVVEGYMDLLAFHARGFNRVAATLGTALTSQQIRLLSRICDEVVLAYDGDDAGERAMLRSLPLFLQEEVAVSCIRFPEGMDPDDFLKKRGMPEFERLVERRVELGAYAVRKATGEWDGSAAGRAKIFSDIQPVFQSVRQPVLQSEYLRIIADRFSISEEVAKAQLLHDKRGRTEKDQPSFKKVYTPKTPEIESLEEKVLRLIIKYPELADFVRDCGAIACFRESRLCAVARVLCGEDACGIVEHSSSRFYDLLAEPDLQELYTRYLLEPYDLYEPEIQLRDWLEALFKREAGRRRKDLETMLREAEQQGDAARIRNILIEIRDLTSKTSAGEFSDNVQEMRTNDG